MICGVCKAEGVNVDHVRECSAVANEGGHPEKVSYFEQAHLRNDPQARTGGKSGFRFNAGRNENYTVNRRGDLPEEDRVYLNVPFKDKDMAKKRFGARWDAGRKAWYVGPGADFQGMPASWTDEPPAKGNAEDIVVDGIYAMKEDVYKVVKAVHGSGKPYAKKLVLETMTDDDDVVIINEGTGEPMRKGFWAYAPGVVNELKPEMLMSQEEQQAYGKLYGACVRCGATLTNEDSIDYGMGPVCRTK